MNKLVQFYTLLIFCSITAFTLQAQISPRISIQGTLKDANGASVDDGTYSVDFKLYNVVSGGAALWIETASVEVTGGIYSHYLGSVTPLNPGIFGNTLYLGVKVGSFELVPRTELTYAPYTFASNTVVCSGAVGDVKYSILNPTQFATANGDCWVPLTGGDMTGSALATILGSTAIPDAGGLFIRAQETAGGGDHDPDRTPTSPIATFEDQAIQAHNHPFSGQTNDAGNHNHGGETGGNGFKRQTEQVQGGAGAVVADDIDDHKHTIQNDGNHSHLFSGNTDNNTGTFSGQETRPKNMNLYIYIRIN